MSNTPAWFDKDPIQYHAGVRSKRTACLEFRTGERLTYRDLDRQIAKCAGLLVKVLGKPLGIRVAILARNSIDLVLLHYACERTGAIFVPLNWRLAGPELRILLEDACPQLFVYEEEFGRAAMEAASGLPSLVTFKISPGSNDFRSAVSAAEAAASTPAGLDAPCTLLYTSGTTGKPKGVIVTRKNIFFGGFNHSIVGQVGPDSVMLCDAPMFHVIGLFGLVRSSFHAGATLAISDRFAPSATLLRISDPELAVTHYFCVPQMAQALIDDPLFRVSDLSRLKGLFLGGAPLSETLAARFLDVHVPVADGFGMSEAGTVTCMPLDLEVIRRKPRSVGLPAPAVEIRLVAADGRDVGPGEPGELWLRGPGVSPGYWNQSEATNRAFVDGWFRTGDVATRDEDGFCEIVDRLKDMYITGGENVYPAEVEAAILTLPGVADAAVVGMPNERWGECGCAYLVLRPGATVTAEQILNHCAGRLARFKLPTWVRFVEAIPRNASGKIRKDVLRHIFAEQSIHRD
jgi:fatty-acyl-CoA synthase